MTVYDKGWSVHRTFGLRREWVQLYLERPDDWMDQGHLGNKQVDALARWLRTTGLLDSNGRETFLCAHARAAGPDDSLVWQLLWAHCALGFATAHWYVRQCSPSTQQTTIELAKALQGFHPALSYRTCYDAILELVGLLERTPIGRELGQGEVFPGSPRLVKRWGLSNPSPGALLYASVRLGQGQGRMTLGLDEDLTWPWIIFGCDRDDALITLATLCQPWGRYEMAN
ncbi:MAG: hypothetical protein HPY83_09280 [Anaerolineae bacterium]|nr:hypothetical protein [Anaerolineae bacterium]